MDPGRISNRLRNGYGEDILVCKENPGRMETERDMSPTIRVPSEFTKRYYRARMTDDDVSRLQSNGIGAADKSSAADKLGSDPTAKSYV